MYIRIETPSGNTIKEEWTFYVTTRRDRIELVLNSYIRSMRPTPRHRKWHPVQRWCRINQRDNTLEERPEPPREVTVELLRRVHAKISIVLDWA